MASSKALYSKFNREAKSPRIEVSVTWENTEGDTLMLEAVAYGPANWLTERMAEKVRIKLVSQKEGKEG